MKEVGEVWELGELGYSTDIQVESEMRELSDKQSNS